ncbi:MAG TPA: RNA degradosome polyphosphate kinase, partial [Oryzihumus sp.]
MTTESPDRVIEEPQPQDAREREAAAEAGEPVRSIASARPRQSNGRFMRVVPSTHGQPGALGPDGLPEDRFLDREISWLQFNERVLQLADDPSVPLLERARYLSIFASNLDEFFMVRVAGLKRRIATGLAMRSASGLEPREVLEQISLVAHELMWMHADTFEKSVRPA